MAPKKKLLFSKHSEEEGNQQNLNSPNDSETDSDSDSESEGGQPNFTPLVPPKKPGFDTPRPEPHSEPDSTDGSECSSPSASGFMIMPSVQPSEKKKPPSFPKKFSDEDETALLQGLAAFWASGKNNKWAEFHQFIKDDLPHQFTKTQLSEKIRSLKRKFENNFKKYQTHGGKLDFLSPHESVIFHLSKTLWGDEEEKNDEINPNPDEEKKNRTPRRNPRKRTRTAAEHEEAKRKKKRVVVEAIDKKDPVEVKDFASEFPLLWASLAGFPRTVKENIHLIRREKAQELEEDWRKLNEDELSLGLRRMKLLTRDLKNQLVNS